MVLFGGNDQELRVTIRAKDEASKDIAKVNQSVGTLAKGFAVGTVAVDALRAGFRFLSGTVTASIREFEEANAVAAQTRAVLQSTGHAAGMSAKEITELADSLARTTLYEDEVIQSAENMLLTFTNITRDIFPQTTEAVLNMSTALGQDLKSSAIQLGKALNNPIEGVSALQRVGVSFTNAQQEMIETMVKSGKTLEAQKFILQEIEKEFGGSAKSAYEAASSITKLQKSVHELEESIGRGLTPALNNVFDSFQAVTKGMGSSVDVGRAVFRTFATIGEFAANTAAGIHFLTGEFVKYGSYVVQVGSIIGIFSKKARQGFSDFRESVQEGIDTTVDFALTLKDKNDDVLEFWDAMNDEARVFGTVGPAAYQATAEEAKKAADAARKAQQAIADTERDLKSLQKALLGDDRAAARAFVEQEQKLSGIRQQLVGETDPTKQAELRSQLAREFSALEAARPQFRGGMGQLLDEEFNRSLKTEFERNLADIAERKLDRVTTDLPQILLNINFNDAVAGDAGIVEIIKKAMATINRETTLRSVAGA